MSFYGLLILQKTNFKLASKWFGTANTCGLNDYNPKTARVSSGFPVFIPKIIARFSWMQNTYMMDPNDRNKHLRADSVEFSAEPALFLI